MGFFKNQIFKSVKRFNTCYFIVKYSIIISLFPFLSISQSNHKNIERFSMEDGLINLSILDLVQDHNGYIWVSSEEGLFKYDGYDFKSYTKIPGDTTSLSENRIEKLYISKDSSLWLGMPGSLNKYIPECDCFHRFGENSTSPFPKDAGQINDFDEDQKGNLWIGTQNGGLYKYNKSANLFQRFLNDSVNGDHLIKDEVRVLLVDKNNNLWIGTGEPFDETISGGGLVRFNLKTGETKRFLHDPSNPRTLIDNRVSSLLEDNQGIIWVGTCENGLHYFDPTSESFIRVMADENNNKGIYAPKGEMGLWTSCPHVRVLDQDKNGGFWIGTYNGGLLYFDPKTKTPTKFTHDPLNPGSLISNAVWTFLNDNQGRVWIGCVPGGLHKIDHSLQKFQVYKHHPNIQNSLSTTDVLSIYGPESEPGKIYIGTRGGGLNYLDLNTDQFGSYRNDPNAENSINNDIVWITYEDNQGTFWVGTQSGLQILDRKTGKFYDYTFSNKNRSSILTVPITRIHEDRLGNLWVGTWSEGIIKINREAQSYKRYHFADGSQQTYYNSVFSIYEDSAENLWVGIFQHGLFQYDIKTDSFIRRIKDYGAVSIYEETQGLLLVGTPHSGLLYYSIEDGVTKNYNMNDGLPSNGIYSIERDGNENYWLATGRGISHLNKNTGKFSNYGFDDGLTISNFNYSASYKSPDGNIYIGGEGGMAVYHPEQIKGNPYPPKVLIKNPVINNQNFELELMPTIASELLNLSHSQNDITFHYLGIHYTIPQKNQYRYKLDSFDEDWIDAGTQRSVRYTNLDPGSYAFRVIAANSDGLWSEEEAVLHFSISPPWWKTWWAYLIFGIGLFAIIFWAYRFQLSRKLAIAESKRLKDINSMKSSLYANITHEFRTPLTVILGLTENLLEISKSNFNVNQTFPLEMIERNGKNLLQLVNKMLDLSKLDSGHMKVNYIQTDMITFIKYYIESFHILAEEKQINLSLHSEIDCLVMDMDTYMMGTILSNLLSNAVKFTGFNGSISVQISHEDVDSEGQLIIKIKDNGQGIPNEDIDQIFERFFQTDSSATRSHEGAGIGLALTKDLANLLDGEISVQSHIGVGTEFKIVLPITNNAPFLTDVGQDILNNEAKISFLDTEVIEKGLAENLPLLLIIEDNPDVVHYLRTILKHQYQILHAENGKAGVEMAKEKIPDIVICDVMMPLMNGFQVCESLKNDEKTNHIPVIMLTARTELEDRLTGLLKGADAYLEKPFEKRELLLRLEKLLEVRQNLQRKYSHTLLSTQNQEDLIIQPTDAFLLKIESIILDNLDDDEFSIDHLAKSLYLSRSQVHRKIKALTGLSTSIYVRMIRLNKAKELLSYGDKTVSEVAYITGFKSPIYFSQVFKETFKVSPTEYRN